VSVRPAVAAAFLACLAAASAAPRPELPRPPGPDAAFYERRVAPWVEAHCAECHRAGGGSFRLASPAVGVSESERRRVLDFEQVKAFVNPEAPWESPFLLEVLDPADGGAAHVGGSFVRAETDEHDLLLDFVSGATLTNLPPEVYLGADLRAKPGEVVVVDGRGSFDRDPEDSLVYRWDLFASPPGSRVALSDVRASRVELTPDLGGTYVLRLRVSDGKVWSAAREVAVEVFERVDPVERAPGGISGLEKVDAEALRRIRRLYLDVLGRPPTPAEAVADEHLAYDRLVASVLVRAEAGRSWFEEACARLDLVRDARPQGEDALGLALRVVAEGTPPHVAEAVLARDPAFAKVHPPGRALAQAVCERLLGRPATEAEIAAAVRLAGESTDVPGLGRVADSAEWIRRVTETEAFQLAAVRRRLERFLASGSVDRQAARGLLAAREGPAAWRAFLEGVLRSTDYLERRVLRPKDPLTFLRGLFVDLLERKPTDRELFALAHAEKALPGRSAPLAALAKVLIDSGEAPLPLLVDIPDAPAWIIDRFLRHLGRRPTLEEKEAFGRALLDPVGGPEVVVRALVTSPEYACR
jgi:hypothetical protein